MRALGFRVATLTGLIVRELLRQNVLYLILIPAVLTLLTLPLFTALTFEEQIKFTRDFCYGTMSIFGVFLAIIATAQSISNDLEQKTIFTILAKPIDRWEYLFSKGLGMSWILFLALLILGVLSAGLFALQEKGLIEAAVGNATHPLSAQELQGLRDQIWNPALLMALLILYFKLILMVGFTILFSTVASSSLFTIFTSLMIYVIGHLQSTAREWMMSSEGISVGMKWGVGFMTVILPDMSFYEGADRILMGASPGLSSLIPSFGYTFFNLFWILGLSTWLFESRDFR